ncbi:MAG: alpha/beta fold hydrolase, partial [Acidobacteria bacterium]|nr:alpha/beta fold hydrolase [Acidobacteriota bacterium]
MGPSRREFLKSAGVAGAMAVAGSPRSAGAGARAQSGDAVLRSVETEVLEIGYEESGDPAGFPIVLLHGFPYDIRAWDGVVPPLAAAGYRVLVPYLRGYGTTRFRDPDAPRMAEQAAIAQDVSDFADALGLEQVALAGFDWGNRAACITSILHPERVRAQVAIGGYSVQDTISPSAPSPSAAAEARLWYQWYFNTERGRAGL